jgi:hypothetical protein
MKMPLCASLMFFFFAFKGDRVILLCKKYWKDKFFLLLKATKSFHYAKKYVWTNLSSINLVIPNESPEKDDLTSNCKFC